jgi:signal transduction histidine kinase
MKASELIDFLQREENTGEAELALEKPGRAGQCFGVTITPMRSGDGSERSGSVVVLRDLQLSHEVQKLRELDAMKKDFLSLVTHELRTPLTGIMSYSETLMMDDSENVPGVWREYIGTIHEEGKRLTRLIDDVLDMTRMGAGEMVYAYEAQDPNELIGSVIMSLTAQFEEKGHELELDLAEDIGECKLAPDRFTQVLLNVVSNAVRFTDAGGRVVISSRKAEPLPGTSVPSLLVTVEDNGRGIAPENIEKVFSKFEIGTAVKNHTSGTGLGMAICKQIIEDGHHGKIWIESEVGKGTKVFVQVPVE